MFRGDQLAINAMKKEFALLSRKAERAKKEADECIAVGTELLAIHQDFAAIVKLGETSEATIKKLGALKKRSERAEKIRNKDLTKVFDKQHQAELDRDALGNEIHMIEFRYSLRPKPALESKQDD